MFSDVLLVPGQQRKGQTVWWKRLFAFHKGRRELRRKIREEGRRERSPRMMYSGCSIRKGPRDTSGNSLAIEFFGLNKFIRFKCLPDPSKKITV